MHLLRLAVLSLFISLGAFAASSDNYTYGSAAWGAAKSWERANEVHYERNSSRTIDMSAAKAEMERYFRNIENNSSRNYDRPSVQYDRYVPPAAPAPPVREATYVEELQARAQAGDAAAMVNLAKVYIHSYQSRATQVKGIGWFEAAANAGSLDGMDRAYSELLYCVFDGHTYHAKDVPRAMGWLKNPLMPAICRGKAASVPRC